MKSIDYIKKELTILYNSNSSIEIRYEYNFLSNMHMIEIKPQELFESSEFMQIEENFETSFIELFPGEELLFISSESISKIENSILELQGKVLQHDFLQIDDIKITSNITPVKSDNKRKASSFVSIFTINSKNTSTYELEELKEM